MIRKDDGTYLKPCTCAPSQQKGHHSHGFGIFSYDKAYMQSLHKLLPSIFFNSETMFERIFIA